MTVPHATVPAAAVHLATYTTSVTAQAAGELVAGIGELWRDARTRPASPLAHATRGLRWWGAMLDREVPCWHLPHETVLSTSFARLLDFTAAEHRDDDVVPTLVLPPQAGHASTVVDVSPTQSQLTVVRDAGLTHLYALEWLPATTATAHVSITDYLDVIDRSIRRMGGRANVIGNCQGGWLAAIYAALHPERVHTLTLAGAPIDFHAGESVIASSTRVLNAALGRAPYQALVALSGGTMPGSAALANFVAIAPQAEISRQLQLLTHVDDAAHVGRYREFEDWFKHTQDIPGAFYLWLVEHLFQRNELISGDLVIDGDVVDMRAITCPLYLLAGSTDHITPAPQLFAAAEAVGTPARDITMATAEGGHLGLFMGRAALSGDWPPLMADVYRRSTPGKR